MSLAEWELRKWPLEESKNAKRSRSLILLAQTCDVQEGNLSQFTDKNTIDTNFGFSSITTRRSNIPLSAELTNMRYQLLGHILRREGSDPARAASYDRFGQPKTLAGTNRWGAVRKSWTTEVLKEAAEELRRQGLISAQGRHPVGHVYGQVATVAQNREQWARWIKHWHDAKTWRDFEFRGSARDPGS